MTLSFDTLVRERRSASNFLPNISISREELNSIFEEVKLAPSAFNLQHTQYVVVQTEELKEQVREAAFGQYKVHSASAAIIVLGDPNAYEHAGDIYEGLKMLGILNKQQYEEMVRETVSFYEQRGADFQKEEAIRNASLSAMLFMLAAKNKGWDTCPMIGFDPEAMKKVLNIQSDLVPVLMITLGKEKVESRQARGYRKPVSEFVTYL
ncbi:nitroreductase family protein [Bacillus safensis]|uniref:nitroreductase family protein n=1 Tax=Bacillus TaxID=1386 RepID=UPI00065D1BA0|nr:MULTISPECIES: nitroreductase family protein [Bacillus]KMK72025.1 NAD(P)H nitroreductase [Bacillus safensis]KUF26876.1 NAD(P)H nitroreductase [Bacillus sp. G1(2015b)]MBG9820936.1 NAD(P)H nitroreductase [Bacillus safensis]MCM3140128.1 nitroreductase family protein [Bacillus safensis]MCY7584088.1 nitroreductase family protein [Bacillus safensis]